MSHLFTGQEYDKETGLYYYNARYYDPHLGMFMRPDPAMDGLNHYAYCRNNPVMYNDPTGMYDSAAAAAHAASYGVSYGNDTSASAGYSASYMSYMTSMHAASYGVSYGNDTTYSPVDNSKEAREDRIKENELWKEITRKILKDYPKGTVIHYAYLLPSKIVKLLEEGKDPSEEKYDPKNPFIRHTVILIKDLRGNIHSFSFMPDGFDCPSLLLAQRGKIAYDDPIENLSNKGKIHGVLITQKIMKAYIIDFFQYENTKQQKIIYNYLFHQKKVRPRYQAIFFNCQGWSFTTFEKLQGIIQ